MALGGNSGTRVRQLRSHRNSGLVQAMLPYLTLPLFCISGPNLFLGGQRFRSQEQKIIIVSNGYTLGEA